MNSRMDKYNNNEKEQISKRNLQNKDKYENTMYDVEEIDYNVEDNVVYINNEEQLQMILNDENAFHKLKKMNDNNTENKVIEVVEEEKVDLEEHTIYDINLFLNSASSNKDKYVSSIKSDNLIDDTLDLYQTDTFFTKHVINTEKIDIKEEPSNIKQIIPKTNNKINEDVIYDENGENDKEKLDSLVEDAEYINMSDHTNIGSKTNKLNKEIINTQVLSPMSLSNMTGMKNIPNDDHTFDLLSDLRASENTVVIPPQKVYGSSLMDVNMEPEVEQRTFKVEVEKPVEINDSNVKISTENEKTNVVKETKKEEVSQTKNLTSKRNIYSDDDDKKEDTFYDGTLSFDKKDFNAKTEKSKKVFITLAILLIIGIIAAVFLFVLMDSKV